MKPNLNPLEKDIEKRVCDYAKSLKMLVYKFTSPSRRSVPDRMFITEKGVVFFIEFKRKGQKPTAAQEVEIKKLIHAGVEVYVIDNVEHGKKTLDTLATPGGFVSQLAQPCTPTKLTYAEELRAALNEVVDSCVSTDDFSASALLKARLALERDPLDEY